jgi:flagella basal body P-ring formation protein FlgA
VALVIGAVLVVGSLVAGGVRAAEQQGRIVVFGDASVDAEVIRLADVARLEGPAAEELAPLEIGRAPAPGRMRTVSGAMILRTLRGHGVDLERVRYLIPATVRVRRHAQEISAMSIRAIAEEYLENQLDRADGLVEVRSVEVPGAVQLAPGPYTSRVAPLRNAPLAGRVQLQVEFLQNERVVSAITVTAHIAVFQDVYVSRRGIPRGTVITAEDILGERRDVSALPRGVITRQEDLIGKEAKVSLPPLTALRHEQFGQPALVRRGEIVTLLAESAGLRITTNGEVREDAPRGAQVRVVNQSSQAEVVGRVMDARTIAVAF